MNPVDYILLAVVLCILAVTGWFVYRTKKRGKKCIGCPDNCACSSTGCTGGCTHCADK